MTTYLDNNSRSTRGLGSSCHSPCLPAWRVCIGMIVLIDGPHRTPPVTLDQGVKQGCPISPLLFALYVHDISKEFLGPVDAVRVLGTPVTHFMKHLTINVGKSKVTVFNGNSQTKHEILPVVREFKYLGMHFNPSATPALAATHMRAGMFLAMRQACKSMGSCMIHMPCVTSLERLCSPWGCMAARYGAMPSLGMVCSSPTQCKHACSAFSGLLPGYVAQCQA
ncbi:retrovirus-related Pol polyprotein LINE-1 [Haematococcus lacustris]|uniref:Retrovirus-related Pol polyprotein LINE-1 n=1 Tax=Haematococcus lacustris TaxID=44745 RepID=A0A699YMB8_HAELA|nr:retrovirus-related Pol polyprotein LINE-1 [Haematococcus lacustris]